METDTKWSDTVGDEKQAARQRKGIKDRVHEERVWADTPPTKQQHQPKKKKQQQQQSEIELEEQDADVPEVHTEEAPKLGLFSPGGLIPQPASDDPTVDPHHHRTNATDFSFNEIPSPKLNSRRQRMDREGGREKGGASRKEGERSNEKLTPSPEARQGDPVPSTIDLPEAAGFDSGRALEAAKEGVEAAVRRAKSLYTVWKNEDSQEKPEKSDLNEEDDAEQEGSIKGKSRRDYSDTVEPKLTARQQAAALLKSKKRALESKVEEVEAPLMEKVRTIPTTLRRSLSNAKHTVENVWAGEEPIVHERVDQAVSWVKSWGLEIPLLFLATLLVLWASVSFVGWMAFPAQPIHQQHTYSDAQQAAQHKYDAHNLRPSQDVPSPSMLDKGLGRIRMADDQLRDGYVGIRERLSDTWHSWNPFSARKYTDHDSMLGVGSDQAMDMNELDHLIHSNNHGYQPVKKPGGKWSTAGSDVLGKIQGEASRLGDTLNDIKDDVSGRVRGVKDDLTQRLHPNDVKIGDSGWVMHKLQDGANNIGERLSDLKEGVAQRIPYMHTEPPKDEGLVHKLQDGANRLGGQLNDLKDGMSDRMRAVKDDINHRMHPNDVRIGDSGWVMHKIQNGANQIGETLTDIKEGVAQRMPNIGRQPPPPKEGWMMHKLHNGATHISEKMGELKEGIAQRMPFGHPPPPKGVMDHIHDGANRMGETLGDLKDGMTDRMRMASDDIAHRLHGKVNHEVPVGDAGWVLHKLKGGATRIGETLSDGVYHIKDKAGHIKDAMWHKFHGKTPGESIHEVLDPENHVIESIEEGHVLEKLNF